MYLILGNFASKIFALRLASQAAAVPLGAEINTI
jgi:hypothetical protein